MMYTECSCEGYTSFANRLDYTAAVLPVSRVDKTVDFPDPSFVALNKRDQLIQSFCKSIINVQESFISRTTILR